MSSKENAASELDRAIARVYSGPLDEFVQHREALVKELRAAGLRDSAGIVKALRKPSRAAWALNLVARTSPGALDTLVAAAEETLAAQTGGGDVRTAMNRLRLAVRDFASESAQAAAQARHSIEAGTLANALQAVLGNADSFAQLRRGILSDIPEAGGLDSLSALATSPPPIARTAPTAPAKPRQLPELELARAAVRRADEVLKSARERWVISQRALREAESKLHASEARLRQAEEEARTARSRNERAREEAESAAAQLHDAENAVAEATRQLDSAKKK